MAPKGVSPIKSSAAMPAKGKGKSPRTPKGGAGSGRGEDDGFSGVRDDMSAFVPEGPSPKTRDECFAALNFDDLPNRSVWEEVVNNMLRDKFSTMVEVFNYYCKHGSDCATIEGASRLKVGAQATLLQPLRCRHLVHAAVCRP